MRVICVLAIVAFGVVLPGIAADLHVPKDFNTVQKAIDAASTGDRIVVSPGVYFESLVINKTIHLVGEEYGSVIISGVSSSQDVIRVDVNQGEVTLENLTITGGTESAGIGVEIGERARVVVTSTVVTGNLWGIVCFGDGQVALRDNYIVDNLSIGLQLGAAVVQVSGNRIYGGNTGMLVFMGKQAELVDNIVALCSYGIVVCTNDCPLWGIGTFEGAILGQRNMVSGYATSACPVDGNWNWPDRFFVDGYEASMRRFLIMLSEATDLGRQQQYNDAREIIADVDALLEKAAFPVPELVKAEIHVAAALLNARAGRSLQAVERFEEAINVYEALGMWAHVARIHNTLGILLRRLGRYPDAVHAYSEAFKALANVPNHTDAEYWQRVTSHNLGVAYLLAGLYEEALRCFEMADLPFLSQVNAAVVLQMLGHYEQSVMVYLEAIDSLCRPTQYTLRLMEVAFSPILLEVEDYVLWGGDLLPSDTFVQLAVAYMNFAITLTEQDLHEEALAYFQRAVYVFETSDLWENCIDAYINMGACRIESGDLDGAVECYEQARKHLAKLSIPDPLRTAVIANAFGEIHRHRGEYEAALAQYAEALDMIAPVGVPELEWRLHFNVGMCCEVLGNLASAQNDYQRAVGILESIRGHLRAEELKLAWGERTQHVYERLIKFLIDQGQGVSAFTYAERCRARTFLDALYQGSISPNQLISPEAGISSGAVDPLAIDQAVADARDSLQPNEAVLEYMVTDTGVYLWVITKEGIGDPVLIKYERAQLMNDVITLRKTLESDTPDPIVLTELLTLFYDKLVKECLSKLPDGVDTLILIPSGPLWYLPFSALIMTDQGGVPSGGLGTRSPYLLEHYTLAYLPSLASLSSLTKEETQPAEGGRLLALADPELSLDQLRASEGSKCGEEEPLGRYEELVVACQEFAKRLVGEEQEEQCVYAGREAQEVRAHVDTGRQVVVYAAHGQFNPYVPLQSKLLLAPGGEANLQTDLDGNYHAWEALLTDHRGTELVVLAACETLLPHLSDLQGTLAVLSDQECDQVELTPQQLEQIVVGDEVVGLARAFLSSGAEAVLGTLWLANPTAIGKLLTSMAEYHKNEGNTWVQALTKAQRELIKDDAFKSPWLWAPYQLIGKWR